MFAGFRRFLTVLSMFAVSSCAGGGGCGGCAGTSPLPGGFARDRAVDNAATVRVSRPGMDFLEQNLPQISAKVGKAEGGLLSFDIPKSDPGPAQIANLSVFGALNLDPNVCVDGPDPNSHPPRCRAQIDIGKSTFLLDAVTPNAIKVHANLPLRLDDTAVKATVSYTPPFGTGAVDLGGITLHLGYGDGSCADNGTPAVIAHVLPVSVTIPLIQETRAPRQGYTKADVANATVDISGVDPANVQVCWPCSFDAPICSAITNSTFVKGLAIEPLKSGLQGAVRSLLSSQVCAAPVPSLNPPCPTGSHPDDGNAHCVFDDQPNVCVPSLLGTDAHVDLGAALKNFSPSTNGGLDFVFAAGGDMHPFPNFLADAQGHTPNGMTLALVGGIAPQPESKCVPHVDRDPPTGIPVPDALAPTVADTAATPHLGVALAGRFLDYASVGLYSSGSLCLGVSTEQFAQLRTGLLSFLIPKLKTLTADLADAPAAITTRPQAPPTIRLGGGTDPTNDPLLSLFLPKFAIDFYIWSFDRYARVFTFTGDLLIPMNLVTAKDATHPNGGIVPALGSVKVSNGQISNGATLLLGDPKIAAAAIQGILGTVAKQAVGPGFAPINPSSALASFGIDLDVAQITRITQGNDDFLAIYGNLAKAPVTTTTIHTTATLLEKVIHPEAMNADTFTHDDLPELVLALDSSADDGATSIEYAWWIDQGTRSVWSPAKNLRVKDDQLFFQGRHVLHVVSRIVGHAETESAPADVAYVIDALAPIANVTRGAGTAQIEAWDVVSAKDTLRARYRVDGQDFGAWKTLAEIGAIDVGSQGLDVEVRDEEGNVRSIREELRGKPDASVTSSSCGCSTPGATEPPRALAVLGFVAALGFVVLRRRGKSAHALLAVFSIGAVASTSQGCACDDTDSGSRCGQDCSSKCLAPTSEGQPGAYLSVAREKSGQLWAAGYNHALLTDDATLLWGDLVVGKYDDKNQKFRWNTIDGVPQRTDGTCGAYPPDSWRGGEDMAGDDVGKWTSMQISDDGHPMVAYYDATHRRLKLAVEDDGWKVGIVSELEGADIGRYAKMILVKGKPVIAYMHHEPGRKGLVRAKVVVARATTTTPHDGHDFTFEDAVVDEEAPCTTDSCGKGEACIRTTGLCQATATDCAAACSDGSMCVAIDGKAQCAALMGEAITYPRGIGAFVSLAQGREGLGIVTYDGWHGNLVALAEGKPWKKTILDGEIGSRTDNTAVDTGDVGIAASLAIDGDGAWHVAYVNGIDESLRYLRFEAGQNRGSEIVDDGYGYLGRAFDQKHIIGDDAVLRVDGNIVTIYYGDSTDLSLRRAVGSPNGATRTWLLKPMTTNTRWFAFPAVVPGDTRVAAWWRQSTPPSTVEGDVLLVAP